jgi:hypothetical protein
MAQKLETWQIEQNIMFATTAAERSYWRAQLPTKGNDNESDKQSGGEACQEVQPGNGSGGS